VQARRAFAEGLIRIGGAAAIPALLRDHGVDPDAVIAEVGFRPGLFDDAENRIPFASLGHLLAICVARTGCSHFGLQVGQQGSPSSLGLVGFLAQHSPDVESALRTLVRYLHHHDRGAVPTLVISEGSAIVGYAIYQPRVEAAEQIADGAIAVIFNIMRRLCGPDWQASEVRFAHRAPPDLGPFRRFFRSPLRFDAEQNAVSFAAEWLKRPLTSADPELRRLLQKQIDELETRMASDFPDQVRRVLRTALLTHAAAANDIATLFSMHPRTLNRHLRACGTTFQQLADEVRFEISRQMLSHSSMTLSEIAAALDYADASAFGRAFCRWSGITPRRWRVERSAAPLGGR
jgi:AraC-like DNA-binding protein